MNKKTAIVIIAFALSAGFTVGDKHQVVGPNASLYCPPGVLHGMRNVGDSVLRYLAIRID